MGMVVEIMEIEITPVMEMATIPKPHSTSM
jgi:hypothetical protein